jgi:hypothetical protein
MTGRDRFVVLGVAPARAGWFREVARWSTTLAIPVDFVKCLSIDELLARLDTGRAVSAVLVDAGVPSLDRDVIDAARAAGAAVVIVDDGRIRRDWLDLGVAAVLPTPFERRELVAVLRQHAPALERRDEPGAGAGPPDPGDGFQGRLVTVIGAPGSGTSTVAAALAHGFGADPRYGGQVVLADLALDAHQALLHDVGVTGPGVLELADAFRAGTPSSSHVRSLTFALDDLSCALLLGLRRHRDWVALRPGAIDAMLGGLQRAFRIVVADVDADLEGEEHTGSVDIEERNALARIAVARADIVVVVGRPDAMGLASMVRVLDDIGDLDVELDRIVPVFNRVAVNRWRRSGASRALADLTADDAFATNPVFLPDQRGHDDRVWSARPPVRALTRPLLAAVDRVLEGLDAGRTPGPVEPIPIVPGSLGRFGDDPLDVDEAS